MSRAAARVSEALESDRRMGSGPTSAWANEKACALADAAVRLLGTGGTP